MTSSTPLNTHVALVSQVIRLLSTRALTHFAQEARLDGESLRDAVDRYDIDYAWHVLGSQRLRDAAVAALETRLTRELTEQQRSDVVAVLNAAALEQPDDLLMSFDNDVASQLAELMIGAWASHSSAETSPANVA